MKHVLASYTGKIQMRRKINMQVGDTQLCLTDVGIDLPILLTRCLKQKSYFTLQPNTFGNHFIDSSYFASFFQVGSWGDEFPEDR